MSPDTSSMISPGASLPQVIYEHSIEASYRGEVLTLVNSDLLFSSGIATMMLVHLLSGNLSNLSDLVLGTVVLLGCVFLGVQCCEYVHLY